KHEGNNYRLNAIHLSEPSPQRTPVLYQAGTSPRGRQFAAQHAECVFMSGPSAKVIAPRVAAIRALAKEMGRSPAEILMFSMMTIILGRTDAEAKAKYDDYRSHVSPEGALTLMSGWTGVDFSTYDLDQQVRHVENDAGRSAMDNVTRADPDRVWTVREVAQHVGIGGAGYARSAGCGGEGRGVNWSRHSGMVRRTSPGISRFRVRCFASPRNDETFNSPNYSPPPRSVSCPAG